MLSSLVVATVLVSIGNSAYCHGKPDPNAQPNTFGSVDSNPRFISSVKNGELYLDGPTEQEIYLVHLYGTPYEMGYAQGQLLNDIIVTFMDEVWQYILSDFPFPAIFPEIENKTLAEALQITAEMTAPWTPDYFYDEMHGLSDATGVPFNIILQVHMLPVITQGHCSMFGAWGDATANSISGDLIQLRALDWDVDGPFKDFPAVIVYHPNEGNGHTFANIAFTGFIGSITGVSSSRCGISEIGVSYPDATFGTESRFGYPFIFLLRDVLQFDNTVSAATNRMTTARRTCDLILGVGCSNNMEFRAYEYSYTTLNVFDWYNMEPYNETWHPRIEDIVYYGMDWLCPGYSLPLSQQLTKFYGNINAENAISNIIAQTQTGNLHIAVYDYHFDNVYMSFHTRSDQNGIQKENAYDRPYIKYDMKQLFADNARRS